VITRRQFLITTGVAAGSLLALGGYAMGIEPALRLVVRRYRLAPPSWPPGLKLTVAVLADIHACEPWMSAERIRRIVEVTMGLGPDLVLLLGDYVVSGMRLVRAHVPPGEWSAALAGLSAPLGVHAILGNHDWWRDDAAQLRGAGPVFARLALENVGIPVYENDARRLEKDGHGFWLAGLGDQLALLPARRWSWEGMIGIDDLPATLAQVTDPAPVILMAHEPDIFPRVPERVALTLAGHTHGGQIRLAGYSPVVPSRYGNRYAYGHIVERRRGAGGGAERHMLISGGLGCSILPVRFGVPPEIVVVELGAP
jgi:hypothetical protein